MQAKQEWKKVIYEESEGITNIKQGYFSDEGDFIKVVGDHSEALIRKDKIISITGKLTGGQDGTRTK
ncbi:MAG: hypothetical protein PHO02_06575 [Candidatus Nanoarchaeia archaeon]|nr:hypothetical protein [Candidatus Nanoarchaeia archaeon]